MDRPRIAARVGASLPDLIGSVKAHGLEGLVAKRRDSGYQPGPRSVAWQKMRVNQGQALVIGYTLGAWKSPPKIASRTRSASPAVGMIERRVQGAILGRPAFLAGQPLQRTSALSIMMYWTHGGYEKNPPTHPLAVRACWPAAGSSPMSSL